MQVDRVLISSILLRTVAAYLVLPCEHGLLVAGAMAFFAPSISRNEGVIFRDPVSIRPNSATHEVRSREWRSCCDISCSNSGSWPVDI